MARNSIAKKTVAEDLTGVSIEFTNGEVIGVTLDALSPEIVRNLALHGLSQKLGDSYSGESDVAVAKTKAEAVAQRLAEGNWKAVREAGSGGRITDLAQALAQVTGKTVEEAVAAIEAMDKAQKSGLRKHPRIKAATAAIAAARAAKAAEDAADAPELVL